MFNVVHALGELAIMYALAHIRLFSKHLHITGFPSLVVSILILHASSTPLGASLWAGTMSFNGR